jgi:hypothetical protein
MTLTEAIVLCQVGWCGDEQHKLYLEAWEMLQAEGQRLKLDRRIADLQAQRAALQQNEPREKRDGD